MNHKILLSKLKLYVYAKQAWIGSLYTLQTEQRKLL